MRAKTLRQTPLALLCLPLVTLGLALTGCGASSQRQVFTHDPSLTRLQSGYGLLHDLLSDVAQVDGILWVKELSEPSEQLIKHIAAAATQGKNQLERFAESDSSITLDRTGLPEAEVAVRDSIASRQQNLLMFTTDDVERDLLLSQAQATQYAWRLCLVIAEDEENADRSEALMALGERFEALEGHVRDRLATRSDEPTDD